MASMGKGFLQRMRQVPPLDLALLLILGGVLIPGPFIAFTDLVPLPLQLDFTAYYLAAQAMLRGQSPYDFAVLRALAAEYGDFQVVAYLYPPTFAVILRPLALLSLPVANGVWFALNVLWLVIACIVIIRLVPLPRRVMGLIPVIAVLMPAVHHTLELGQINTLLLVLLAGALWAFGRPVRTG